MNILVVDDEMVSRMKVTKLLSPYGECSEAEDGASALCMFGFAGGSGNPYDLISMDVEMPGLRGPDVVKAIRQWEAKLGLDYASGKGVKIIMLTSHSDMGNIYSAYKQLCDEYIVKPVTPEKIRDTLAKLGLSKPAS